METLEEIKKERNFVPLFMYVERLEDYCEQLEKKYNQSLEVIIGLSNDIQKLKGK